jgi:hypothetical protein
LRVEQREVREPDYEQDILFALDWGGLDPAPLVAKIPDNFASAERQMRRIRLADSGKERIYPDFNFAMRPGGAYDAGDRLVVLEMKGEHLQGNPDTESKQAVLRLMTEAFDIDHTQRVGELELINPDGARVQSDLVLMTEWKTRLPTGFLSE